jgi:thiol:disulfide interchange protein
MRTFRAGLGLSLAALLTFSGGVPQAADSASKDGPTVKIVTYSKLGELIKKNRGKVVVVDFWATW